MRLVRRKVRFSTLELLERVWLKKKVKLKTLRHDYAGVSISVVWDNLQTLERGGLVRSRRIPNMVFAGKRPKYWKLTPLGSKVLARLYDYRDYWEMIQPREVDALARAERVLERLDAHHAQVFGEPVPTKENGGYFRARGPRSDSGKL